MGMKLASLKPCSIDSKEVEVGGEVTLTLLIVALEVP